MLRTDEGDVKAWPESTGRHSSTSTRCSPAVRDGAARNGSVVTSPRAPGSRMTSRVRPMMISSRSDNVRGANNRSPLTLVPFVEPTSVMHHAGPMCSSTAWTRETAGSSAIGRSLVELLPMESRPLDSSSTTRSWPVGPNRSNVAMTPPPPS